jgi:hypothetical protein
LIKCILLEVVRLKLRGCRILRLVCMNKSISIDIRILLKVIRISRHLRLGYLKLLCLLILWRIIEISCRTESSGNWVKPILLLPKLKLKFRLSYGRLNICRRSKVGNLVLIKLLLLGLKLELLLVLNLISTKVLRHWLLSEIKRFLSLIRSESLVVLIKIRVLLSLVSLMKLGLILILIGISVLLLSAL